MADYPYYRPTFLDTHYGRLLSPDGTDLGVVTIAEAMRRAKKAGLTLIEFDTTVEPIVFKMLNAEQYEQHLRDTQRFVN